MSDVSPCKTLMFSCLFISPRCKDVFFPLRLGSGCQEDGGCHGHSQHRDTQDTHLQEFIAIEVSLTWIGNKTTFFETLWTRQEQGAPAGLGKGQGPSQGQEQVLPQGQVLESQVRQARLGQCSFYVDSSFRQSPLLPIIRLCSPAFVCPLSLPRRSFHTSRPQWAGGKDYYKVKNG